MLPYQKKQLNIGLLIILLLSLHLAGLTFYMEKQVNLSNSESQNPANHALLIMLINASQNLSAEKLKSLYTNFSQHKIKIHNNVIAVSLTQQPEWPTRFNENYSLEKLEDYLVQNHHETKISYQLRQGDWLNYSELRLSASYDIAMIFSGVELVVLILILFYGLSLRRFTLPLKNFKESADRLGIDMNAQKIEIYGPKIVRETADAMNKMQTRIQELINNRTQMLAAISHDLRTPITRLKLLAQFIKDEQKSQKIINNLDEMEKMIDGVLAFSREDMNKEKKIVVDLNALLTSICDDYADQGHNIHINALKYRLPFLGHPLELKRAFNNLIQNAIKYGGEAWVNIHKVANAIHISIKDSGPGIPEEELSKVLKPYYRSESSYAEKNITGTGLGLTVAHEIIQAHHGIIELKNNTEGGLMEIVQLPCSAY